MWKYKLTCLFGGYGGVTFALTMLAAWLCLTFSLLGADLDPRWELLGLAPLVIPLVVLCIVHVPRASDRDYRQNAEPPDWKPLPAGHFLRGMMQEHAKARIIAILLIPGIPMLIAALLWIFCDLAFWGQVGCAVVIGASFLGVLVGVLIYLFWLDPPAGVEYCMLPAAYSYLVPTGRRHSFRHASVIVFFLPSGKCRLYLDSENTPSELYFVRFHGFVWWAQWYCL